MNLKVWIQGCLGLVLLTGALACNPKSDIDDKFDKLNADLEANRKKNDELIEKFKKQGAEFLALKMKGGMPGTILLSPIVARENPKDGSLEVDSRLKIIQQGGRGDDGKVVEFKVKDSLQISKPLTSEQAQAIDDKFKELRAEIAAKESKGKKRQEKLTYLNVGCGPLPEAQIKGLTQVKLLLQAFTTLEARATKVFICGQGKIEQSIGHIFADELILKDADYTIHHQKGWMISITARILHLEGQSRFSAIAMDSESPGFAISPSIGLHVHESVQGAGTLELKTVGSSYVKSEAPKADEKK